MTLLTTLMTTLVSIGVSLVDGTASGGCVGWGCTIAKLEICLAHYQDTPLPKIADLSDRDLCPSFLGGKLAQIASYLPGSLANVLTHQNGALVSGSPPWSAITGNCQYWYRPLHCNLPGHLVLVLPASGSDKLAALTILERPDSLYGC